MTMLALVASLTAHGPLMAADILTGAEPVKVRTRSIETFRIGSRDERFGRLTFLGGLEILAPDRKVGGLSGAISLKGGSELLAVTDNGHWVAFTLEQGTNGEPLGIKDMRYAPLRGADGKTLRARWGHDTEALTLAPDGLYVSAERNHAIYHYPWPLATGQEWMIGQLALPEALTSLPRNKGIEAIAAGPPDGPLAGKLVGISESSRSDLQDFTAFVLGSGGRERFSIRRHDGFDATDAAFLANGDLLLLERRFNLTSLIGMRLRQIPGHQIKAGSVATGELLLEADFNDQIDNMEALAIHENAAGQTILTLMSDNNRSLLQRALLLRFRLD